MLGRMGLRENKLKKEATFPFSLLLLVADGSLEVAVDYAAYYFRVCLLRDVCENVILRAMNDYAVMQRVNLGSLMVSA